MEYLIIVISLILDAVLSNFIPFMTNDLSIFTPMFTIVSVFIIYPFYKKREKNYFITIFILGIIYDLAFTNLLFFNGIMFLLIGYLTYLIYKNLKITYIKLILYIILIISIYEITSCLIFLIYNLIPLSLPKVIYKITHSLLLNIIYGEIVYLLLNKLSKKYKKISIN